ncbi:membrane protein [Streptomyces aureocirculatus]|uniref:membrane protein n=1 Tax=Streptomyces aureocirculatus TaxID=67275 RepID=UPI0004CBB2CC|nr:membrane protein [Streptomyces aureocirculatus]
MSKLFLILHVLAAILAVGPVAVAASIFPRVLRAALAAPGAAAPVTTLRTLHRICRVYAGAGIAVVVFGFATASSLGVLGSPWLITSIVLTFVAAVVLIVLVLPRQEQALDAVGGAEAAPTGAGGPGGAHAASGESGGAQGSSGESGGAHGTSGAGTVTLDARASAQLAMYTGIFNLLWATVTILMIVRPGSTTGA